MISELTSHRSEPRRGGQVSATHTGDHPRARARKWRQFYEIRRGDRRARIPRELPRFRGTGRRLLSVCEHFGKKRLVFTVFHESQEAAFTCWFGFGTHRWR